VSNFVLDASLTLQWFLEDEAVIDARHAQPPGAMPPPDVPRSCAVPSALSVKTCLFAGDPKDDGAQAL
jgi:hypothetical protein